MNDASSPRKNITTFVAVLAIVLVTGGVSVYANKHKASDTLGMGGNTGTNAVVSQASADSSTGASVTSNNSSDVPVKDGTYSATSSYYVPHGSESIKVTLTVKNGVITDSQIANSENDRDSADFQERFAAAYKTYVVGKKAAGLHIQYIAGASDTADGFNDAVSKIVSQAQNQNS